MVLAGGQKGVHLYRLDAARLACARGDLLLLSTPIERVRSIAH